MCFEDGSTMKLYRQTVEDFGLYPGLELTEEAYKKLKEAASKMSARMRAVRIVSAAGVSKKDLEHRLIQKGEDPTQARAAVEWMSELDLVDDRKTAQQIVARCISRGYGMQRAKQALYEKRIPKAYWQEALEEYPDQSNAITDYLRQHITDAADEKQRRKAIDALVRRGHSFSQIRRGLEHLSLDTDDFPEDE